MSGYLSCAETARLVRQALKEAFPGVKFGVRSSTYSGGASINVRWTDGPAPAQVEAVAKVFQGGYFDGMTDFKGSRRSLFRGEVVRFGADFVFCERDHSDRLIDNTIASVFARIWSTGGLVMPTALDYREGRCGCVRPPHSNYTLSMLIWRHLCRRTDRIAQPSPLAQSVTYLGNDGHSPVGALQDVDP